MFKPFIFFLILTSVIFSAASYAQHDKSKAIIDRTYGTVNIKTPTDTLQPASFSAGTPVLYSFVDGGYCFGNSPLLDRAFAQKYVVPLSYKVEGMAIWISAKQIVGSADTLSINYYRLEGPGVDTGGAVANAPDTAQFTAMITTADIDTGGLTFVLFPDSFYTYVDFAVGIDITTMSDDTLGLVSTTDGDAASTQLSWVKYADGTWHTVLEPTNWGMDLDFGIFMIADMSAANVNDDYFFDGIKLSQNQPNPASSSTLIMYETEVEGNVVFEIYDASGKKVLCQNEGCQAKGKHEFMLNTSAFEKGIYFYSLCCGNHRIIKKMIIE